MRTARILFSLLPLFCLTGCQNKFLDEPSDTNLDFYLTELMDEKKLEEKGAVYIPAWFGAAEYLDGRYEPIKGEAGSFFTVEEPEIRVTYLFSGYPDLSDPWRCTRIYINDPNIYIYGLSMKSSEEEVAKKMEELSFKKGEESCYYKNGCSFYFSSTHISMSTPEPTNKNNIVY